MEDNKKIKISLKTAIIIAVIIIILFVILIVGIYQINESKTNSKSNNVKNYSEFQIEAHNEENNIENNIENSELPTETDIQNKNYSIEYSLDNYDKGFLTTTEEETTKYEIFDNYTDYIDCYNTIDSWATDLIGDYTKHTNDEIDAAVAESPKSYSDPEKYKEDLINKYKEIVEDRVVEIKEGFKREEYSETFFENNDLILIEHSVYGKVLHEMEINNIKKTKDKLNVQFDTEVSGIVGGGQCRIFFIIIPKEDMGTIKNINVCVDSTDPSNSKIDPLRILNPVDKPIIYLYPCEKTSVSLKLLKKDNITCSYPKYIDGWNVIADINGNLVDNETGRSLYSLYYECENAVKFNIEDEGFVVKGTNVAEFLEEKLEILGLTEREAEEFIIYWLPKLEANKYNYIRFATLDEMNENMPLEINPKPDTIIRVLMTFKGLESPIDVKEQQLETPERKGFVAVEWGGTEIK